MRTAIPLTVLVTGLACSLFTAPAQARARVFVASYGNDANPCTFGSPCKTFQQAVNVVDAGGEVTAIDSAGFGPISISKAVTITSPDGVEAGIVPTAGGDAIDINAGATDGIVLRGLTLNGSGVGFNGVVFNSGGSLTVINCVAQDFVFDGTHTSTGNGILFQPTSGTFDFSITNSIFANNGNAGIFASPPFGSGTVNANGVVDHVAATGNNFGMGFAPFHSSGGLFVTAVSNSVASNNKSIGIWVDGGPIIVSVSINNTNVSGNATGIQAQNTVKAFLGHSVITGNVVPIANSTSPNAFFTFQNNQFDTSISGLITSLPLQ
jgi:hypothetical protein